MRAPAPAALRNWAPRISAVFLLIVGGYSAVFASIYSAVNNAERSAMSKHTGNRVQALCELVDCQNCGLAERNRAVWALGQLRDSAALPVLTKYYTGQKCNHESALCQHELQKAVDAIQRRPPVWLGYRDFANR